MASTGFIRWGVLGTAMIAEKLIHTINKTPGCKVVAVASRTIERAEAWCSEKGLGAESVRRYGSYEELLADDDVNVVYCPLPTSMHKEWVAKIAKAGKHVLVEKPAGLSSQEVEEMVAQCQAAGVQFMDGVMFSHHVRLPVMAESVTQTLGTVTRLNSSFHFYGNPDFYESNIRVKKDMDALGCIGDLGWYCVRAFISLLGRDPVSCSAFAHKRSADGVITSCTGTLFFDDGVFAAFDCGFDAHLRQELVVSGSEASLRCTDFVLNRSEASSDYTISTAGFEGYGIKDEIKTLQGGACCQELRMVERMRDIARSGVLEDEWPQLTVRTQRICDAILASADAPSAGRLVRIAQ